MSKERASITLERMPDGYPNADARDWDAFRRGFLASAKERANRLGCSVEVYDDTDSLIAVVEPDPSH